MTDKPRIPIVDVEQVVTELTDNTVKRAIILMMYTSGLSFAKIKELKQSDLINACKDYMDEGEDIKSLLKRKPIEENMIPMWNLSKGDTKRLTFSSPQSLHFIFQHLSERTDECEYLFVNNNGNNLDKRYLTEWLTPLFRSKINDTYDEGNDKFTSKGLSNSFTQLCTSCPPEHINSDEILKLFEGSKNKRAKKFYENILNDKTVLLDYYKKLLPCLTVNLTKTNMASPNVFTEETNNQSTSAHKHYSNDEIRQILKNYYMEHFNTDLQMDYNKYNYMMNIAYRIAIFQNSEFNLFDKDGEYLKNLFLKAQIHWLFHTHPNKVEIKYCPNDNKEEIINQVYEVIEEVGILGLFPIDYDLVKEYFFTCPDFPLAHYYDECTYITLSDIADIVSSYVR